MPMDLKAAVQASQGDKPAGSARMRRNSLRLSRVSGSLRNVADEAAQLAKQEAEKRANAVAEARKGDEHHERMASVWFNLGGHTPIIKYNAAEPMVALVSWSGTVFPLILKRPDFWLMNLFHFLLLMIYQYGGSKDAFNDFKLELSSVSFILTLTTFFVVIYSQTAALRFKTMYDKTCGVSEGVQEICIWVSCYFPGDKNERVRWEIARHVIAAQFLLFLGLNGQSMDDDNWDAFSGTMLMNPKEVDELRVWTGPPLFYLPIMKALENSRLALHARQAGRVFDPEAPQQMKDNAAPKKKVALRSSNDVRASTPIRSGDSAGRDMTATHPTAKPKRPRAASTDSMVTPPSSLDTPAMEAPPAGPPAREPNQFYDILGNKVNKQDSTTIAVQHSEILNLCLKLRGSCAQVYNDNNNPPPFSYFHVLNFMITCTGLSLAYALIFLDSLGSILVMVFITFVIISLREVSSDMTDPFYGDDGDFPIATWLKQSMQLLVHTTYMSKRSNYMSLVTPLPSQHLVEDSISRIEKDFKMHKKVRRRFTDVPTSEELEAEAKAEEEEKLKTPMSIKDYAVTLDDVDL